MVIYFVIHMCDSLAYVGHVIYFLSSMSDERLQRTEIQFLVCVFEVNITVFSFIHQHLIWAEKYLWYEVRNSLYCVMFTLQ
jgi:hypothetical protein